MGATPVPLVKLHHYRFETKDYALPKSLGSRGSLKVNLVETGSTSAGLVSD